MLCHALKHSATLTTHYYFFPLFAGPITYSLRRPSTPLMPDDHSELVPPLPIPNRTVKRLHANDSADTRVKVGNRQASLPKTPTMQRWGFCLLGPQKHRPDRQ